ncbi:hypothetical protein G7046_g4590 [Stylonectria norvegica]|nr:hypothetical protein G7046_g4590 [Stylonectria norvegica]
MDHGWRRIQYYGLTLSAPDVPWSMALVPDLQVHRKNPATAAASSDSHTPGRQASAAPAVTAPRFIAPLAVRHDALQWIVQAQGETPTARRQHDLANLTRRLTTTLLAAAHRAPAHAMYAPRTLLRTARHFRLSRSSSTALPLRVRTAVPVPILVLGPRLFSHTCPRRSQDDRRLELLRQDDRRQQLLRAARPLVPDKIAGRFARAGSSRNSRLLVLATVLSAIGFYIYNSQTVPVTGRRRFNFMSDAMVARANSSAAGQIIKQVQAQGGHFLSDWDPRTRLVKRVMKRLIPVSGMTDLNWEIYVIADNRTANAFVLPGGKVFVHSGILNVCRNEDALAAVLGHEIAHNTASHAAERLSAAWVGNLTAGSLFFLAGALPGLALFGIWSFVGGFYLQDLLFYLPMGRKQESEADYIGLMMMAEACYDPRQAVGFWERMEHIQRTGGQETPEMLSTHPSNETRISKINEWMPKALEKQAASDCMGTSSFAGRFRTAMRRGTAMAAA